MIDNIPLRRAPPDEGHRALSSASVLAAGGDDAHHVRDDQVQHAREEISDPFEGGFIAMLDGAGVPVGTVAGMRTWLEAGGKAESLERDKADEEEAHRELIAAWGGEERASAEFGRLRSFLRALPKDELDVFLHARDEAGRLYQHDSAFIVRMVGLARSRGTAVGELNTVEAIEKYMRTNRRAYDGDEGLQARYRELLDARR